MSKISEEYKKVRKRIAKDVFDEDSKGRAVVKINITDADSLLSPYNDDGMEIISSETATFIDNLTKSIPNKQDMHLKISCENYTPDKEHVYKNAIKNYYINEFAHCDERLKYNLLISLVMLVISMVAFAVLYVLYAVNTPDILCILVEILAWVFAWEAVDMLFIRRRLIKFDQRKYAKIIFAEVTFTNLKK